MQMQNIEFIFHHLIDIGQHLFFGEEMPANIQHQATPGKTRIVDYFCHRNETAISHYHFLEQSKRILKPGGKLLVQIINYNRILDQGLKGLPTIENDEIKFERIYSYGKKPEKVDFKTKLTIKATGKIIENSVPLLALRPGIFRNLLEEAGFTNIEEFGSFKKDLFEPDSQPYIVKAE